MAAPTINQGGFMSFIRKIPGFRSGKIWKMGLASFFYIILFFGIIDAVSSPSSPEQKTHLNSETTNQQKVPICKPNWQCSDWSSCTPSGTQTRACTDFNNCKVTTNKPVESQRCNYVAPAEVIGKAFTVGSVQYNITKVFTSSVIGNGIYKFADGIYVLIGMTIENEGKDYTLLNSGSFIIEDAEGRKYNADTTAMIYLSSWGYQPLLLKNLGGGLTTAGYIVFDVPKDDKGLELLIDTGIFDKDKRIIIGDVAMLRKII